MTHSVPLQISNNSNSSYFFTSQQQGYLLQPQNYVSVPCQTDQVLYVFEEQENRFNLICVLQALHESTQPLFIAAKDVATPMFSIMYGHLIKKMSPEEFATQQKKERDTLLAQASAKLSAQNAQASPMPSAQELKQAMLKQAITELQQKVAAQNRGQNGTAATIKNKMTPTR
jgi:hypothetical protein